MKVPLISRLTVEKDRRQFEYEIKQGGHIKQFFAKYRMHSNALLKINLFFMVFALPLLLVLMLLPGYIERDILSAYNFTGNLGIGFPGNIDSIAAAQQELYLGYFKVVLAAACAVLIAGIGAAGLFYTTRNISWGVKLRPFRDFFKGIKLFFVPFFITFLVLSALVIGEGYVILWHLALKAAGNATVWSYLAFFACIILSLFLLMVVINLLPMFSAYKLKYMDNVKNSVILALSLAPVGVFLALGSAFPAMLVMLSSSTGFFIYFIFLMFGGSFYGLMWTSYSHYASDMTINALYKANFSKAEYKNIKKKDTDSKSGASKNSKDINYTSSYKSKAKEKKKHNG